MQGEQLLSHATNLAKQLKKKLASLLPSNDDIIAISTGKYDFSFALYSVKALTIHELPLKMQQCFP